MTIDDFFNKVKGKKIDYDGVYKNQCVDLIKQYEFDVMCIIPEAVGDAKDYYLNFENKKFLKNHFIKIPNTPDYVPLKGDVVVFGGGKYGHICIATGEGNTSYFYSYDQNVGGNLEPVQRCWHNYKNCLGALRPKTLGGNFTPYIVSVICDVLNVRKSPTLSARVTTQVKRGGAFTIIDEVKADGYTWGKLKSGAGWIALKYTKPINMI